MFNKTLLYLFILFLNTLFYTILFLFLNTLFIYLFYIDERHKYSVTNTLSILKPSLNVNAMLIQCFTLYSTFELFVIAFGEDQNTAS